MKEVNESKLTPQIPEEDIIVREVNVQASVSKKKKYSQFFIQIPAVIVEELDLKKGDTVIFKLPIDDKSQYSIKFKKTIK